MIKKAQLLILFVSLILIFTSPSAFAAWVWSPESGKFVNPDAAVQDSPQEQYDYALEFYKKKDLKEAITQLRLLLKRYAGAQVAPEAQYRLGAIYEEMGDYYKAFRAYRDLLQRYPQSERMSEAVEREFRIGNLFLSGRKAKLMGLAILPSGPRAIEIFKHVVEAAPYSAYGEQAQFHLGLAYKKTNQFEEAIQAFQTLTEQYPKSKLIPQARFQIADTSYLQSVVATRDQKVIDRASKELERFLTHYPDSSVSDKAARLRQEIDEKNSEKNYRIALFYEKENFLDSAFIYYRDVAERYPHTQWGKEAVERLQALERPVDFLKSQEAGIAAKKEKLLSEIQTVGDSDHARKKDLEWELKRIEKEEKEVRKSKPETVKRRLAALKQKEASLHEKRKALAKKRKHFSKNPSEDLTHAFERWEASLDKEEQDLLREKQQIKGWGRDLGVRTQPFYADLVPFRKEALSPLEQVHEIEAERYEEITKKKRELLMEKEDLYHQYEKLLAREGLTGQGEPAFEDTRTKLEDQALGIENLEDQLKGKQALYKKLFGIPAWKAVLRVPTSVIGHSVDALNPFEASPRKDWASKSPEELRILKGHWNEKVAAQKKLVDIISQAFDEELSRGERKETDLKEEEQEMDAPTLRKTVKQLEREIRSHYNEIQDRNDRKNELLEEMARVIHGKQEDKGGASGAGKVLTAPARGMYQFWKAFLFGLPERDVELTEEAQRVSSQGDQPGRLQKLKDQIELESLLIETRNQEILRLKQQVEALRAQSSLSGAPAFRSLLIKFPYVFIREAIVSANRLVPKKERSDKLIEQLNKETANLERLRKELSEIEGLLKKKPAPPQESFSPKPHAETSPDQKVLQGEIRSLEKQLDLLVGDYEYRLEGFEKTRWDKLSEGRSKARTKKLKKVEVHLVRLIEEERKIQEEEKTILARKKEIVGQFLDQAPADLFTKELHREREQIDSRLNEIQKQEITLGEELRRFRPQALPPS